MHSEIIVTFVDGACGGEPEHLCGRFIMAEPRRGRKSPGGALQINRSGGCSCIANLRVSF